MTASLPYSTFDGYQWLKRDIIRGIYQPDEKLRMSLLTSRYGLGVGPLREALSQLVAEHLVTVVSQKGYRVASMSQAELLDIFDARANMESMLVQLAIERGKDDWEAEILARSHMLAKLEASDASEDLLDEWDQRHQHFTRRLLPDVDRNTCCKCVLDCLISRRATASFGCVKPCFPWRC